MPTQATRRPSQLLYTRTRNQILTDLAASGLSPGDRYYTESELAQRYHVSRNTVRRAMAELEKRRYLRRQRGLGILVERLPGDSDQNTATHKRPAARQTPAGRRLVVILPRWDDTSEGFYAGRILRELTAVDTARRSTIELLHPNDFLDFAVTQDLSCLAIDPSFQMAHRLSELAAQVLPIVTAAAAYTMPFALNLADDNRQAIRQAVHRFYDLGHRRIGIVLQDLRHRDYTQSLTGFIDAHKELGLSIAPDAIVQFFDGDPGEVEARPRVDRITAWIGTFNGSTHLLAQACHAQGLSIPEDVSLVGLDDPGEQAGAVGGRGLSVVRSDPVATAQTLMSCLEHWEEHVRGQTILLPMQVIDRQTIAPPHGSFRV